MKMVETKHVLDVPPFFSDEDTRTSIQVVVIILCSLHWHFMSAYVMCEGNVHDFFSHLGSAK